MLTITQFSLLTGFCSFSLVFMITLVRQKRFDRNDLGAYGATYFSGFNIPSAILLCIFCFDPESESVLSQTRLAGHEKYLFFSGLALLFLSITTIWTFIKSAYTISVDPVTMEKLEETKR